MAKKSSKLAKIKSKKTILYATIIIVAVIFMLIIGINKFQLTGLTIGSKQAAIVNGEAITEKELDKQYEIFTKYRQYFNIEDDHEFNMEYDYF